MEDLLLEQIEGQIGYKFKNNNLLQQAFILKSYAVENNMKANDELTLIGNSTLSFIAFKLLNNFYAKDYSNICITSNSLLSDNRLAEIVDSMMLADYLIISKDDVKNKVKNDVAVKANLLKAIIGAICLDLEYDVEKMEMIVDFIIDTYSYFNESLYISKLTEWFKRKYKSIPCYSTKLDRKGAIISLKLLDKSFKSSGKTSSEAKALLCEEIYNYLDKHDLLITIKNEIENPSEEMAVNQLEILARRGYFSVPTYKDSSKIENGEEIFRVRCLIKEIEETTIASSNSKKKAKKDAAYQMLMLILQNKVRINDDKSQ